MSQTQRSDESCKRDSERKPPRRRKVWIKTRPMSGIPPATKASEGQPPEGTHNHWRRLHWALEVGPWTIEVAVQGKMSSEMAIHIRHHTQSTSDWDHEVDRVCVGESTMSDNRVFDARDYASTRSGGYKLSEMNCQGVAAGLAVLVCDNSFEVFKVLERLSFFSIQSLMIPMVWLKSYHKLSKMDPMLWQCGLSVVRMMREEAQNFRGTDELDINMYLMQAHAFMV